MQIPADGLNVLIEFPPKSLDLSNNGDCLSTFPETSGDTLVVKQKPQNSVQNFEQVQNVNQQRIDEGRGRKFLPVPRDSTEASCSIG